MNIIKLYLNLENSFLIFAMAYARLSLVFFILPVLSERVLSNLIVKNVLIALAIIGLWPCFQHVINPEQGIFIILFKELFIGLVLAIVICIPFWVVISLGELLDNQRGATLSESIDPLNGEQSSILSGYLNYTFGALFFASGGMLRLVSSMAKSYEIVPAGSEIANFHFYETGGLIIFLIQNSIMLAAPVLIIMMITEMLLGIFSRYCPQLNPFSLSLAVKSFIAFTVYLFYGIPALNSKPMHMLQIDLFSKLFN